MDDRWVELLVTFDALEADMIRDLLESGGIAVRIRSSKTTPYPVNIGKMGEVKLLVRQQDKETAQRAVEEFRGQDEQDA